MLKAKLNELQEAYQKQKEQERINEEGIDEVGNKLTVHVIEAFLDVVEIQDCDPYCVVQLEASQDEKRTPHFIKTKTPK